MQVPGKSKKGQSQNLIDRIQAGMAMGFATQPNSPVPLAPSLPLAPTAQPAPPSPWVSQAIQLAMLVESQIDKELSLITARTGWMLTSQSIIFSVYTALLAVNPKDLGSGQMHSFWLMQQCIPLFSCILIGAAASAIFAAISMLYYLHDVREKYAEYLNRNTTPAIDAQLMTLGNRRWSARIGIIVPPLIAATLLAGWVLLYLAVVRKMPDPSLAALR